MSLSKDIEELQRKAGSYDLLTEEFERLKEGVRQVIDILANISGKTISTGKKGTYGKHNKYDGIINQLYDRMKTEDGFQLRTQTVRKALEDAGITVNDTNKIDYTLLNKITKLEGVIKEKDKEGIRLFYHKPADDEDKVKFAKTTVMG